MSNFDKFWDQFGNKLQPNSPFKWAVLVFTLGLTATSGWAGEGHDGSMDEQRPPATQSIAKPIPVGKTFQSLEIPSQELLDVTTDDAKDISLTELFRLSRTKFVKHVFASNLKFHSVFRDDYPFYHSAIAPHKVRILNDGIVDLEMRLRMIERAKSKIDYMTYLFTPDAAGRLILDALVDRARHGVQVRLLVDWFNDAGKPGITEPLVAALKRYAALPAVAGQPVGSFEVRYYNKGTLSLGNLEWISHRNHIKILVADDRELLMGGRNTAAEYFTLSKTDLNWLDRDIWTYSTNPDPRLNVAAQADAAFNEYWNDTVWTMLPAPVIVDNATLTGSAPQATFDLRTAWNTLVAPQDRAQQLTLRREIALKGSEVLGAPSQDLIGQGTGEVPLFTVAKLTLVLDRPAHADAFRRVTPVVHWRLANAKNLVMIENYTVPASDAKFGILAYLAQVVRVPVMIMTNSLNTVDAPQGAPRLGLYTQRDLLRWNRNVTALNLSGNPEPSQVKLEGWSFSGKYGTHAKSAVIYDPVHAATMVGSYNFDERSELLNNEALLIVEDNPVVAEYVARSMKNRFTEAHRLLDTPDGKPYYSDNSPLNDPGPPFWTGLVNIFGLGEKVRLEY